MGGTGIQGPIGPQGPVGTTQGPIGPIGNIGPRGPNGGAIGASTSVDGWSYNGKAFDMVFTSGYLQSANQR